MAAVNSDTPQKITFDHKVIESSPRVGGAALICGMSKPFLMVAALIIFVVGGAGVPGWLQLPPLLTQKKDLQDQVNIISTTVDRLASENDRLKGNNDRLDRSIDELGETRDDLNNTVIQLLTNLTEVKVDLNITNQELQIQVNNLTEANFRYEEENGILANMTQRLEQTVSDFETDVERFNGEINRLQDVSYELNNTIAEQNETLTKLEGFIMNYTAEVIRLESLNNQTVESLDFLNMTAFGIDTTFEDGTNELAEQIGTIRFLTVKNLENEYLQRIDGWDCKYRDWSRPFPWGQDYTLPITNMESVINWLDQNIFQEVCLDDANFELFLNAQRSDGVVNSDELIQAATTYNNNAFGYYFPKPGEVGLTPEDWARDGLRCEDLGDSTYEWSSEYSL